MKSAPASERATFSFPADPTSGAGREWSGGGLAGRAYGAIVTDLAAALPRWLAEGEVSEGEPLKPPHVFRVGELVVKFFPAPTVFGWLRLPRAVRSAERHFSCRPIPSPRPLIALSRRRGGASLLVREFVPGRLLSEIWGRDEAAERALAALLSEMRRCGVVHGDLHPRNLLWTGERWCLLDLDGVRHRLHSPARVLEGQWARLLFHLEDEARVERLYRRVLELHPEGLQPTWAGIARRARALRASRGLPPAGGR